MAIWIAQWVGPDLLKFCIQNYKFLSRTFSAIIIIPPVILQNKQLKKNIQKYFSNKKFSFIV